MQRNIQKKQPLKRFSLFNILILTLLCTFMALNTNAQVGDPAPVVLASFTAKDTQDGVRLEWKTKSENGNLGFHIFRAESPDGLYLPITIQIISGAGQSQQVHQYSYVDQTALQGKVYYYKLAFVSSNGTMHMSEPVSVPSMLQQEYGLVQDSSDPFSAETQITFKLKDAGLTVLEIRDLQGQKLRTLIKKEMPQGIHHVKWDGRDDDGNLLPAGQYLCFMRVNDFEQTQQISLRKQNSAKDVKKDLVFSK